MQPKSDAAGSGYAPILPVIRTSNSSHNTEELKDAVRRWKNRKSDHVQNVATPTQKVASTRSSVLSGHSSAPSLPDSKMSSIALAVDSVAASKAGAQDSSSMGGGAKDFAGPLTFEAIMEIKKKSRVESKSAAPNAVPVPPKAAPSAPAQSKSSMSNPLISNPSGIPAIRTKDLPALPHRIKTVTPSDGSQEIINSVPKSNPISAPPPPEHNVVALSAGTPLASTPPENSGTNLTSSPPSESSAVIATAPSVKSPAQPEPVAEISKVSPPNPLICQSEISENQALAMTDGPVVSDEAPPVIDTTNEEKPPSSNAAPNNPPSSTSELPSLKSPDAAEKPSEHPAQTLLVATSSTASLIGVPSVVVENQLSQKDVVVENPPPINRVVPSSTEPNPVEQSPKNVDAEIIAKPANAAAPPMKTMPVVKESSVVKPKMVVAQQNPLVDRVKKAASTKTAACSGSEAKSARLSKAPSTKQTPAVVGQKKELEKANPAQTKVVAPQAKAVVDRILREPAVRKTAAAVPASKPEKISEDASEKHGPRIRATMVNKEPRAANNSGPFAKMNIATGRVSSSTPTSRGGGVGGKATFPQTNPAPVQELVVVQTTITTPEKNQSDQMIVEPKQSRVEPVSETLTSSLEQIVPEERSEDLMLKALKGIGSEVMLTEWLKAHLHLNAFETTANSGPPGHHHQTPLRILPHPAYVMPMYAPQPAPVSNEPVIDQAAVKQAQEAASAAWRERVEKVTYNSLDTLVRDLERMSASELAKLPGDEQSVVLEHRDRLLNNLLDQVCGNL